MHDYLIWPFPAMSDSRRRGSLIRRRLSVLRSEDGDHSAVRRTVLNLQIKLMGEPKATFARSIILFPQPILFPTDWELR